MDVLSDLQKWYASNCDEEWEHTYGVQIGTLDNPGWTVTIDLEETNLEGKSFQRVQENISETDWLECWVDGMKFRGFGDPKKLEKIVKIFVDWAKFENEEWLKPPPPMTDEEREQYDDERFFASLGDEVESERCRQEGCAWDRIRNSVMCRRHHFEMVTKRPAPERAS